ncbi:MAG: UbiA prenyltransferase family protein [Bacilli bacterium]|jgi:decaprenyl-phosphate phosphoribosyltransferase
MKCGIKDYIKLIRPKHYLKNILIFLPLIFSGHFFNIELLKISLFGFFSFCMAASTIYIVNDIKDREKDKMHDIKKNRPIASGKISVKKAVVLSIITFIIAMFFQFLTQKIFGFIFVVLYVIMNIAYSFKLKDIPLIDISIIVIGFLIRVLYGAYLINVEVSNWLLLTVISISFYLALGKRRNEIKKNGSNSRKVLKYYTVDFLDKNMYLSLTLALTFYSLWCNDNVNEKLIWTVPLAIMTCMKYSMIVEDDSYGDPVDVILSNISLLILLFILGISLFGVLYFG